MGATGATAFVGKVLVVPYLFQILVGLSLFLATFSAWFYLNKLGCLSFDGIKKRWQYLLTLYLTTIGVSLLFFAIIFPRLTNSALPVLPVPKAAVLSSVRLEVAIPCPGHALLIITEVKKISGIQDVVFEYPNIFKVVYDSSKVSPETILQQEIFKSFKAVLRS